MIEPALAHWIYDQLVEHAGAPEPGRADFVAFVGSRTTCEYRFQGSLGFGGKFWNADSRYYVTCYREDETPERAERIRRVNALLAGARAGTPREATP